MCINHFRNKLNEQHTEFKITTVVPMDNIKSEKSPNNNNPNNESPEKIIAPTQNDQIQNISPTENLI